MSDAADRSGDYEYIVVGSGAGGGTVAARLAEAGCRVLLLEAGGDPCTAAAAAPGDGIPEHYRVPVFHAFASENPALRWDFFVRHYADDARQRRDDKYCEKQDGVLYPRAGTLGGCTSHNAMLVVYPHNSDWDDIARLTGDESWSASNMRRYFQRIENCRHRPPYRLLAKLGIDPSRHGWNGWLPTRKAIPEAALADRPLKRTIFESWAATLGKPSGWLARLRWALMSQGDPNDWRLVQDDAEGVHYVPLSTRDGERYGTRERVLETAARHREHLHVELDALATRVLFDDSLRAIGVEYLKGARLYRAHAQPATNEGERRTVYASREVILAGGAFNTPQLLMLSGVGPRDALAAHGIACRVDLPGVGRNLQDRYEVGVVNRMPSDWPILEGCTFAKGDRRFVEWDAKPRKGVYTTNGAVMAFVARSAPTKRVPDLFCFALLGKFRGYFPGYSKLFPQHLDYLTWAILKAHTNNRAGVVTLRSADPRDPPRVDFRYFDEGSAGGEEDLDAVVAGVKLVRRMTASLCERKLCEEEEPGPRVQSDEAIREYVKDNAWGHHASCTCPIGPREAGGVLDSAFRVHGTRALRVVDASVFPRIPGFFIVSAVYMIAEKAADAILAER
ncbi:MAG TPA: GMC family oxidoreductase [Burkholderiales bacterium]|nr:GMC family oxidoreductase [Burkholderiales bacterium]